MEVNKMNKYVIIEQDLESDNGDVFITKIRASNVRIALDSHCDITGGNLVILNEDAWKQIKGMN
jgi:hypothetical protein